MATAATQTSVNPDQQLVDRVVYLCSLAADPVALNPMTDRLRTVTARWQPGQPMSPNDRKTLTELEQDLKTYLTTKDPLRSFTKESLEQRVQQGQASRPQNMISLLVVLGVSLLAAGVPFLLPLNELSLTFRALLTVPLFFLTLHIGIAWFYFSALRNFKKEYRSAFTYICIGLLLLSIGFSQYVVIQWFGWEDEPPFKYGGITALISICFIFMYAGLRKYAQLLQLKTKLTSLTLVLGLTLGATVLAVLLPHGPVENEAYFDFSFAWVTYLPLYALMGAGLAHAIIKNVTPVYGRSMQWLYRYLIVVGAGSLIANTALAVIGELNGAALYTVIALCGVAPQLMLLYTGYSFKKETSR